MFIFVNEAIPKARNDGRFFDVFETASFQENRCKGKKNFLTQKIFFNNRHSFFNNYLFFWPTIVLFWPTIYFLWL